MRHDGLTDLEGIVMDALCDAVDAWNELDEQHPDEAQEFSAAVHRLQDLLAVRVCRRWFSAGWVTYGGPQESEVQGGSSQAEERPRRGQSNPPEREGGEGEGRGSGEVQGEEEGSSAEVGEGEAAFEADEGRTQAVAMWRRG